MLKWALGFFCFAVTAALVGFANVLGDPLEGTARFLFFLCSALFVILTLTYLFIGDDGNLQKKT